MKKKFRTFKKGEQCYQLHRDYTPIARSIPRITKAEIIMYHPGKDQYLITWKEDPKTTIGYSQWVSPNDIFTKKEIKNRLFNNCKAYFANFDKQIALLNQEGKIILNAYKTILKSLKNNRSK